MKWKDQVLYIQLCNMLRNAKLSTLSYEDRLWWANFWYFAFEICIAAGAASATGTGVAALTIWKAGIGVYIWYAVTTSATILAFLMPIVAPGERLQTYSRQHQGWYGLYLSFERLLLSVRQSDQFSDEDHKTFTQLFDRRTALNLADVKCLNARLVKRLKNQVNEEIPAEDLASMPIEHRDPVLPKPQQSTSHFGADLPGPETRRVGT